jgi:pilus assembly protein CpaB
VFQGKAPLLLALALGGLSGATAWAAMRARDGKIRDRWQTTHVLCAARDIPEGTELLEAMIAVKEIPAQFITASFIQAGEDGAIQKDSPVGQRVLVPLKAGDPILASHFEPAREPGFSSLITPRGRAVTIEVQEKNAVGLWVRPNDHVDVIGSFRDPQTQQLRTMTLLQNVVVLATGHITASTVHVPEEEKRFSTVTLLALPEEAEMLAVAQELGTLTLLLRNPDDLDAQEKRAVIDEKTLFAGDRARELQQKRYRTIQIIRGNRGGPAAAETREW